MTFEVLMLLMFLSFALLKSFERSLEVDQPPPAAPGSQSPGVEEFLGRGKVAVRIDRIFKKASAG